MRADPPLVAVLVARYPSLTETFIEREIQGLQRLGVAIRVWGCENGPKHWSPLLRRRTTELVPCSLRGLWLAAQARAIAASLHRRLPNRVAHVHAHFLHLPALVAAELAHRRRIGFSISAHARDIFVPEVDLETLCERARFISVCSQHARTALLQALPSRLHPRISLHRHGLPIDDHPLLQRTQRQPNDPLHVLTVGRMVPKKGLDDLAFAITRALTNGVDIRWRLIGDGPLSDRIRNLVDALGLVRRTEFAGARPVTTEDLVWAHLLALGCRRAPDGDRDGVSNAILEAMASGIPAVAGSAGGTPEVVHHLRTGWLAGRSRTHDLAEGLQTLARDPQLCNTLGRNARALIEREYSWQVTLPPLAALLDEHARS